MKNSPKILTSIYNRAGIGSSGQLALTQSSGLPSHVRLAMLIALTVFVCEMLVMFILSFMTFLPSWFHALAIQRNRAEEALQSAKDELGKRVATRTTELAQANERLKEQINERIRVQAQIE